MAKDLRLVCDRCHAYRNLEPGAPTVVSALREDARLGPWLVEHDDCRPPVRITTADDERLEGYRENYEEA
jgi:hypothetical protein